MRPAATGEVSVCGASGRNFQVLQVKAGDLLERRGRDDAAPDRGCGLVDGDEHDEARIARGHDADERGDVPRRRVPAARIRLGRSPGLAGDRVAGELGLLAGSLDDHVLHHPQYLARDMRGKDPARNHRRAGRSSPTRSTRCGCSQTPPLATVP